MSSGGWTCVVFNNENVFQRFFISSAKCCVAMPVQQLLNVESQSVSPYLDCLFVVGKLEPIPAEFGHKAGVHPGHQSSTGPTQR